MIDQPTLHQFIGTEHYYRFSPLSPSVLTDGTKYVADEAGAYWLFETIESILADRDAHEISPFISIELLTTKNTASLTVGDGNGVVIQKMKIPYTDFPLPSFTAYACWSEGFWVHMLPSEY